MVTIGEKLGYIASKNQWIEAKKHCYQGLTEDTKRVLRHQGIQVYTGKVRDVLLRQSSLSSEPTLLLLHSDRLTAFDRLITLIPYKGVILAKLAAFWLKEASQVVPTHFVEQVDERTLLCKAAVPIKVEVVIRGYLAGSMLRAYLGGQRIFGGTTLPDGLTPYQKLPTPIITPTTKAAAYEHDLEVTPREVIERGLCQPKTWEALSDYAHQLFAFGTKLLGQHGWILVDTKYEFGLTPQGNLIVIDEIHTPDSSRFWVSSTYPARLAEKLPPDMLDKERIRRWLLEQGYQGEGPVPEVPLSNGLDLATTYLKVLETLQGGPAQTMGVYQESAMLREIQKII